MSGDETSTPRVLIVEDDQLVATYMQQTLADARIDVIGQAHDRDSAFSMVRANAPDVALVDIALADGETGREIATALSDQGIDCIFVTGRQYDLEGSGAVGVLHKPVRPDELVSAVRYAMALRHGGLAPDPPTYLRLFRARYPQR